LFDRGPAEVQITILHERKDLSVKWVALIIFLAAIVPVSNWLRNNPRAAPKIWILMGFLPFGISPLHLYMAPIFWADWAGYVTGTKFSALDSLALAIYISLPRARSPLPFRLSMALYFSAVLLSVVQAEVPMAALFYAWQLARMFLIYAVVARGCGDPRVPTALLTGMAVGLFWQAGVVLWQRVGLNMLQAAGTEGHQNALGMASHFIVFPFFALLLAGQGRWLPAAAVLAGAIVEALTTSRATIGLAGLGYATVFVLSALRRWTSLKALVLLVGMATVAVATPFVLSSIAQRGADQLRGSDESRVQLERAAATMLSDNFMGVGADNFVDAANVRGYDQQAGVDWTSRGAIVHNVYWLVAAETGYPGLITFVFFLLRPLTVALRCGWRNRGDKRGDLLLGLGAALMVVYIHSMFEWVFIADQLQYMFAMEMGLVAGLAAQLGYWRRPNPQSVRGLERHGDRIHAPAFQRGLRPVEGVTTAAGDKRP
jgi:O-antigen ligase